MYATFVFQSKSLQRAFPTICNANLEVYGIYLQKMFKVITFASTEVYNLQLCSLLCQPTSQIQDTVD